MTVDPEVVLRKIVTELEWANLDDDEYVVLDGTMSVTPEEMAYLRSLQTRDP